MTNKIASGTTNSAETQGYGNLTLKRGVVTNEASAKGGTDVAIEMLTLETEGFETEASADTLVLIADADASGGKLPEPTIWDIYAGKHIPPGYDEDDRDVLAWSWETTDSGVRFGDGLSGRQPDTASDAGRPPSHTPEWTNPNDTDPGVSYDGF